MDNKEINISADCEITINPELAEKEGNFTITSKALDELRKVIDTNNISKDYFIRFGIDGCGCNGANFTMQFDNEADNNDRTYDASDLKVVIDTKSIVYMSGLTLDYVDSADGQGFLFKGTTNCPTCGMEVERH